MTTIINLTPHTVNIVNPDNEIVHSYPSAGVARVATKSEVVGGVDGIAISRTTFGEVIGLPEPSEGNIYIVSMVVAQAVSGRLDVVAPDSGPTAYRYSGGPQKGQIIGVRGFVKY